MRFSWDLEKAAESAGKHGVTFEEAAEVFTDPNMLDEYDATHSDEKPRYAMIGLSSRRLLFVVYTEEPGPVIRLISAHRATERQRQSYEDENKKT